MIAIDVPFYGTHGPTWWNNFIAQTNPYVHVDRDLPKKEQRYQWRQYIDQELMKYGGRLQPSYMTNKNTADMLVTFRLESNYTMFLLKFS